MEGSVDLVFLPWYIAAHLVGRVEDRSVAAIPVLRVLFVISSCLNPAPHAFVAVYFLGTFMTVCFNLREPPQNLLTFEP